MVKINILSALRLLIKRLFCNHTFAISGTFWTNRIGFFKIKNRVLVTRWKCIKCDAIDDDYTIPDMAENKPKK